MENVDKEKEIVSEAIMTIKEALIFYLEMKEGYAIDAAVVQAEQIIMEAVQ